MDGVIEHFTLKDKIKISALIYIMMLSCGMAVILPFVLKSSAAQELHLPDSMAGYAFSFYMVGMLIGQLANGHIIKFIKLKTEIVILAVVFLACVLSMYFIHTMGQLVAVEIIIGVIFGIVCTLPFYIVVHTFDGRNRASQTNILDLFFGVGSFTFPIIAGRMLANNIDWKGVYASIIIIWVIILVLMLFAKLPDVSKVNVELAEKAHAKDKVHFSKWSFNVYLIMFVIFADFVCFTGFNYYMPEFLHTSFSIPMATAFLGLTYFWLLYAIGCGAAGFFVKIMPENIYMMISSVIAMVGIFLIFKASSPGLMFFAVSIFGYGCSTIYGSSIAYGASLIAKPSPRLVSTFICISGIGTWFGEFYSSWVHAKFGSGSIILISGVLEIALLFVVIYVTLNEKAKRSQKQL